MIFAVIQESTSDSLSTLGIPGLVCVVLALVGVVVFLYRQNDKLRDRLDNIQEQRITEAKETRDKLSEPLEKQALMSEKIYDLLINSRSS